MTQSILYGVLNYYVHTFIGFHLPLKMRRSCTIITVHWMTINSIQKCIWYSQLPLPPFLPLSCSPSYEQSRQGTSPYSPSAAEWCPCHECPATKCPLLLPACSEWAGEADSPWAHTSLCRDVCYTHITHNNILSLLVYLVRNEKFTHTHHTHTQKGKV